jgi:hypothetical protein
METADGKRILNVLVMPLEMRLTNLAGIPVYADACIRPLRDY